MLVLLFVTRLSFAEDFDKDGNNGSASCDAYCQNNGENWGRAGMCVGGRIIAGAGAPGPILCAATLPKGGHVICRCHAPNGPAPGSFEKPQNNGSVTCNTFCSNQGENWGRVGTCTGARSEGGAFGGRNIGCNQLQPGNVVCYCRPPDGPPPGSVEKPGDNGTATCDKYCRNDGENWGPAGICVGGRIDAGPGAGANLACNTDVHTSSANIVCYCKRPPGPAPGAFEKKGNNGSVTCDQYCGNAVEDWGQYGQCQGGRVERGAGAGMNISCSQSLAGTTDDICYCKPQAPPALPAGAFEKTGNNGTASCNAFCENADEDWGRYGSCVGGRGIAGPLQGADLGCSRTLPALGSVGCYCVPTSPPRAAVPPNFEKLGNNGTVSCAKFCANDGAVWGPLGACLDANVIDGKFKGKHLGCDATSPGSNVRCLCGPPPPPKTPHFSTPSPNPIAKCCGDLVQLGGASLQTYGCKNEHQAVWTATILDLPPEQDAAFCKSNKANIPGVGLTLPTSCGQGQAIFAVDDPTCGSSCSGVSEIGVVNTTTDELVVWLLDQTSSSLKNEGHLAPSAAKRLSPLENDHWYAVYLVDVAWVKSHNASFCSSGDPSCTFSADSADEANGAIRYPDQFVKTSAVDIRACSASAIGYDVSNDSLYSTGPARDIVAPPPGFKKVVLSGRTAPVSGAPIRRNLPGPPALRGNSGNCTGCAIGNDSPASAMSALVIACCLILRTAGRKRRACRWG